MLGFVSLPSALAQWCEGSAVGYRILGVDPGLTRCGIGVIESGPGRGVKLIDVGVIRTDPATDLADRLHQIHLELDTWLARLEPHALAVERVFAQHNVRTVTGTAQVAGVAMVAARARGISVASHTPSEVKAAVSGHGRAPKEQVQEMVRRILALETRPKPADAADALALAITHAWRSGGALGQASVMAGAGGPQTPAQRAWAAAAARTSGPARRGVNVGRTR